MILKLEDIGNAFQVERVTTSEKNAYQKGKYRVRLLGNAVGFAEIGNEKSVIEPLIFSNWVDEFDVAFPTLQDLLDDIAVKCFFAAAAGGAAGWPLTGSFNLTGAVIMEDFTTQNGQDFIMESDDSLDASRFTMQSADLKMEGFTSGETFPISRIGVSANIASMQGINESTNAVITELRVSPTQMQITDSRATTLGLVYAADYSADFVDRSFVDKAYADTAGWAKAGTTNLTGAVIIDFGNDATRSFQLNNTGATQQILVDETNAIGHEGFIQFNSALNDSFQEFSQFIMDRNLAGLPGIKCGFLLSTTTVGISEAFAIASPTVSVGGGISSVLKIESGNTTFVEAFSVEAQADNILLGTEDFTVRLRSFVSGAQVTFIEYDTALATVSLLNQVNMPNLPTSAAGLNTGDLWNNSGVLNIAP